MHSNTINYNYNQITVHELLYIEKVQSPQIVLQNLQFEIFSSFTINFIY